MTYRICMLVFSVALLTVNCKKDKADDAVNPAGLQAMIPGSCSSTCSPYVDEYQWRGQAIYLSSCVGVTCKCAIALYLASGETLKLEAGYNAFDFLNEAVFVRHVYKC